MTASWSVADTKARLFESARKDRIIRDLASRDLRRSVIGLVEQRVTQVELAKELRMSQPAVSQLVARARRETPVADGFSGASPFEICQRYAAGLIDRGRLVDELIRWDYAEVLPLVPGDDLVSEVPGSVQEVEDAYFQGLIGDSEYQDVYAGWEVLSNSRG